MRRSTLLFVLVFLALPLVGLASVAIGLGGFVVATLSLLLLVSGFAIALPLLAVD